jgi:hypothetical protein
LIQGRGFVAVFEPHAEAVAFDAAHGVDLCAESGIAVGILPHSGDDRGCEQNPEDDDGNTNGFDGQLGLCKVRVPVTPLTRRASEAWGGASRDLRGFRVGTATRAADRGERSLLNDLCEKSQRWL